jgi:uncharacterized protein YjiS (DUF1127 family)
MKETTMSKLSVPFRRDLARSTALPSLMAAVRDAVRVLKDRVEVRKLATWDDRELRDIGLTRADVEGALAQPFWELPSRTLARRAPRR